MNVNTKDSNSNHTQGSHAQIKKEKKRIIVGVDFGTSTTKVMYRAVELGEHPKLIYFNHSHRKFSSYTMPSTIRLDAEHQFWFGALAENGNSRVFRSFKVCVACQAGAIACRGCGQMGSENDMLRGCFADSILNFITAHELMVYYLAWLLYEIETIILQKLGEFDEPDFQYNLGVPVEHLNAKPELEDRFEWVLYAAVALRGKIQQGISAAQARSLLIEILPKSVPPQPDHRIHRALPETAAAALWLQKTAQNVDDTNYMLVDIGAGTTDITIYRYNSVNPDVLPIYGANSIAVAGDNIDYSTIQWFAKQCGAEIKNPYLLSPVLLQEMRLKKETLLKPNKPLGATIGMKEFRLDVKTYITEIVTPHAETIFKTLSDAFGLAYRKAHHASQWKEIYIVLLGGGSRISGMQDYFGMHRLRDFMDQRLFELPYPGLEDSHLLAVAYGLAYPSVEFPSYRMPNQILPMQQIEQKREPEYNANPLLSN